MASQASEPLILVAGPVEERPQPPIDVVQAPGQEMPAPTLEQVRAADAVFARKSSESEQVAGILGMWMGGMLLKDILQDTLATPTDEPEADGKKKQKLPHPQ
jgi:hypothetical protein